MADIHSAAQKNDLASIQASVVVDAIIFLLVRSGGGSHRTPLRCIAMMLRHVQEFQQNGGDINARNSCANPQPDISHFLAAAESAPSTACDALPVLAENKCFGAYPVPLYAPFFGGYPHPAKPALLLSSLMPS
jgi:hypothetical protein